MLGGTHGKRGLDGKEWARKEGSRRRWWSKIVQKGRKAGSATMTSRALVQRSRCVGGNRVGRMRRKMECKVAPATMTSGAGRYGGSVERKG